MDPQEVDGDPRQCDADADQGVDGVAVQRHGHQEDAAQAEDHGVGQRQLWRGRPPGGARGQPAPSCSHGINSTELWEKNTNRSHIQLRPESRSREEVTLGCGSVVAFLKVGRNTL